MHHVRSRFTVTRTLFILYPLLYEDDFHECGLHSQWSESGGDQCRPIRTMATTTNFYLNLYYYTSYIS